MKKHMRVVVALCAALSLVAGSSVLLAQKGDNKAKEVKRSKAEQIDIDTLVTVVDNVAAGKIPAPTDVAITWSSSDFFRAPDGTTYVPFTVTIDRSKLASPTTAIYLRAADKAAAAAAPPPAKGKDKTADTLDVIYWVYGAMGDANGKPDLSVENSFNIKNADGTEKFFNKTQPQALNAQSPYNVMQGIPNFLEVPLASFTPGDYRL